MLSDPLEGKFTFLPSNNPGQIFSTYLKGALYLQLNLNQSPALALNMTLMESIIIPYGIHRHISVVSRPIHLQSQGL